MRWRQQIFRQCYGRPEKMAKIGGIIFPNPNAPSGRLLAQDAFEDALLMECEEGQIRAVFQEVIAGLENPYSQG